jgi:hypothetical protein
MRYTSLVTAIEFQAFELRQFEGDLVDLVVRAVRSRCASRPRLASNLRAQLAQFLDAKLLKAAERSVCACS